MINTIPIKVQKQDIQISSNKKNLTPVSHPLMLTKAHLQPVSSESFKAHFIPFLGKKQEQPFDITEILQNTDKIYQGKGLINETGCIDWNKTGWENLRKEPLDWEKAKKQDIIAFYHAMALAEAKDNTKAIRFNPDNVPEPLATYHTIKSQEAQDMHAKLLSRLDKLSSSNDAEFLNMPLLDNKTGNINVDVTVFDTETTGIKLNPSALDYEAIDEAPNQQPPPITLTGNDNDRIIQIGAVKIKKGNKIDEKDILNQLVNPEKAIPSGATAVHHITDEMVSSPNVPNMNKILKQFNNEYLGNNLIVAYNAKFDISMLNNSIFEYNEKNSEKIKPRELCLVIDPFVLIQRIHPFLGASKKLTDQHKFLFGKDFEGAHDALADATATTNILKYCCLYLSKHYHAEQTGKPLTVKDLLSFQFGGKVNGLDIELKNGYDQSKSYKNSYKLTPVTVKNYPDGYKIEKPKRKETKEFTEKWNNLVGEQNTQVIIDEMLGRHYKTYEHFSDAIENSGIEPFNNLDKKDVIKLIAEHSKTVLNDETKLLWLKNKKKLSKAS